VQYINLRIKKLSAAQASQNAFCAERQKDIHLKEHAVLWNSSRGTAISQVYW